MKRSSKTLPRELIEQELAFTLKSLENPPREQVELADPLELEAAYQAVTETIPEKT